MIYLLGIFILCAGFYTLTYGLSLWNDDRNKLGGFGAILIAILGTLLPIAFLIIRR